MKSFFAKLWGSPARRSIIIGLVALTGIGGPLAVTIGTAVDEGISQYQQAEQAAETGR